ncbi:MAG TPA: SPW repeat protein [Bacillota bacterium]|nr:SPW repeat protein [Bacillota bacterium]
MNGNFHLIHVVLGAWLVLAPLLGIFATFQGLVWNSVIIGAVVGLYNAWYLFGRQQQPVKGNQ